MDYLLKYKQIAIKLGVPLIVLAFILFIIFNGSSSKNNISNENINELSLFKEDELVNTRYIDSVEDKLNIAVTTQDDLKQQNEKIKNELDSLKQLILKKESNFNSNKEEDTLYKNFPINEESFKNNNIEPTIIEPKIMYRLMDQKYEGEIDENFGKKIENKEPIKKSIKKIYIPTTSITTGTLLHGLNAPTSMNQPMPTVVMIKEVAFLPNRKKLNIKECNLLVEGYGQLSDERVYFKFTKFACVNNDGAKVYDTQAQGYLTSLVDNKQGLPGHVVSKQNEMLKRMFLAGIFEGAADMFKDSGSTQIISGLGTTTAQSTELSDKTKNLIGGGLSKASESAKDLYLEKARNISETVEVLAQDVGLVFTDGLLLEPLDLEKKELKNENSN
ncbi:MAG: TraB/VirB10 family protein [Arcobacteraceae bacterium]